MALIRQILDGVRFLGWDAILKSVIFARYRDRWSPQRRLPPAEASPIGHLSGVHDTERGVELTFGHAVLHVEFLSDDLVHLTWSPGKHSPTYAIAQRNWPTVRLTRTRGEGKIIISASRLSLRLEDSGAVAFYDPDGNLLRQDDPPKLTGEGWTQQSPLRPGELIFGLGERSVGLNLRPGRYRLWNADPSGGYLPGHDPLYMSIPVVAGLHTEGAYMVFYNNPHDGWLELGDRAEIEFSAGELDTYFIAGPLNSALPRFLDLTGRPPMPPRWALGLHQSRWGYKSQEEIQAVLDGYRFHDLPLSAVHLDIDYMHGYRVFTVDHDRFPDMPGLADKLHAAGVRLVAILDPGVKQIDDYDVYGSGVEGGHICLLPNGQVMRGLVWPGWVGFPDFTRPATRAWWSSLYRRLLDLGIDGFWHDMNEPTCFSAWGETTFPGRARHDLDGIGGDHNDAHNLYALQMNRAGFEGLRAHQPDRRPFLLTRSGWAGVQRYAWHWTGDTVSSWEDLQITVPSLLGLSLSGVFFSGSDIGGFNGHPNADLYLRWFALACLVPFCRVHSAVSAPPREPWRYGQEVVYDVRQLLAFRQSLMPYLYTLSADAAEQGQPLIRPVLWFDPSDSQLWSVEDSFALGPHLLAAPVLHPDQSSRELRLPRGGWYDFWDEGRRLEGGAQVTLPAGGSLPPVLVHEGCILPTQEGSTLILTLYLPNSGEAHGSLYEDLGDGYGPHRWNHFVASGEETSWQLSWTSAGDFPFDYQGVLIRVPSSRGKIASLSVDGITVPPGEIVPPFARADISLTV